MIHDHGFIHVVVCFIEILVYMYVWEYHLWTLQFVLTTILALHCLIKKPLVVTLKSGWFTLLSWYIWMANWMTYNNLIHLLYFKSILALSFMWLNLIHFTILGSFFLFSSHEFLYFHFLHPSHFSPFPKVQPLSLLDFFNKDWHGQKTFL